MEFSTYAVSGNGTNSDPVPAPNYVVAPQASSLSEVVNKLTVGFTLLKSSQLTSNDNINTLDRQLKDTFSLTGAALAYAAQQINSS